MLVECLEMFLRRNLEYLARFILVIILIANMTNAKENKVKTKAFEDAAARNDNLSLSTSKTCIFYAPNMVIEYFAEIWDHPTTSISASSIGSSFNQ